MGDPIPSLVRSTRFLTGSTETDHKSPTENRHGGWLIVQGTTSDPLYCTPGASQIATFFRSSAKPFQAFPLVETGFAEALTEEELAVACASHTGSPRHLALVRAILEKAGLNEAALQCGPHWPLDKESVQTLQSTHAEPTALHNNCSGKHAAMLYTCIRAGWDPASYLQPQHPLQQRILEVLKTWSGIAQIPTAIDGCGAPVFYLPLQAMARLYAHLGSAPEFAPIRQAMSSHPETVGGMGRADTVIMQASQGQLLAKVGADGVICVSHTEKAQGLALKMADGNNEIRNLTVVEMLIRLNWLTPEQATDSRLTPYRQLERLNTQGQVIGRHEILPPETSPC